MPAKLNFTKAALDKLVPPSTGQRLTVHDDRIPGLQLRVTAGGAKTFSLFRRTKGGAPARITLGRYPTMTIEQARKAASNLNLAIEGGSNPARIKREARAELTFADLFSEYLARHSKLKKRTWKEDKAKYDTYLSRSLGPKRLSALERSHIAAVHAAITKAGHPVTANRVLALVSSVFGWAVSADLAAANPAVGVKRNPEQGRARFLQPKELPRFFQSLADEANETVRDYFLMSLLTGARRANVLAMRWQDIDFDEAKWEIARTKNGDPQTIPLMREALAILEARRDHDDSPYVFPGPGKSGHLVEPKLGWRRIFDRDELRQLAAAIEARAGALKRLDNETTEETLTRARAQAAKLKIDTSSTRMADLRIHDLRRTLGSWQARTGASLSVIGKSLSHKSVQTTAIYARLDTDPVRESMERATSAMLAAVNNPQPAQVRKIRKKS